MSPITLLATAALVCASVNTNAATTINTSHLQHKYNYDARGRVTSRTAYTWDGNQWLPALRWTYQYTTTGYTIELARWNAERKDYEAPFSKTVYAFTPGQSAAFVSTYTRKSEDAEYELQDTLLAAFPDASLLDCIASSK